ncbi:uncharacterized protein LOC114760960 [Neltuma alba]|uniref:uncharacterized protein LOC114760960 n=1 Tax=Neltuma alba TaxID=207710 RepID=UPI0010A51BE5|nr:uncharacterized protein LOC114760960 [Prosopis alba]
MASSLSSFAMTKTFSKFTSTQQPNGLNPGNQRPNAVLIRCESSEDQLSVGKDVAAKGSKKLQIGSPIIVIEAPKVIKTAASVPCLRANSGLVKPGDVGRIVSRKPKDVWAVRLSIGTYLLDGKYFKPLDMADFS